MFVAVHKVFVEIKGGAAKAVDAVVVDVFFVFVVPVVKGTRVARSSTFPPKTT